MKTLKKLLLSPWTALVTLALIVAVTVQGPTFVESVRLRYFGANQAFCQSQSHRWVTAGYGAA